ncbi:DUF262 domain-containing protein [Planctomycetota bacterium]
MPNADRNEKTTLNRPPEARGFKVEQLLQEAELGRLRIPAFQRPLRWKSKNVIEFFDSIRRGFPVGGLLLSRDEARAEAVSFGPVSIDSVEQSAALWVIDGQQRITALVATLLRTDTVPRRDYWSIWYDLENEEFRLLQKREANPVWMPLNVLGDSKKQLKWIKDWPYAETNDILVDRALEIGKAIREFEIPAYIVEGAEQELLRLIFKRANSSGVDMRESEIFEALYGEEGDKPIASAVARLSDTAFGLLNADLFLRCLRVTCGLVDSTNDVPPDSIKRTEKAFRRAILAIKEAAGIPHWKLLPYRLPLIVLVAFYDAFPQRNSRIDRLAARWIWRGALSGDHSDVTDARVKRIVNSIRNRENANDAMMELLTDFREFSVTNGINTNPNVEFLQDVSFKRASAKIFMLGLLAADPKSPAITKQQEFWSESIEDDDVSISGGNSEEIDPKNLHRSLTSSGSRGSDIVVYIPEMKTSDILDCSPKQLEGFLLNIDCVEQLRQGNIDEFRRIRVAILGDYFAKFTADRVGDSTDLRPAINAIAVGLKTTGN